MADYSVKLLSPKPGLQYLEENGEIYFDTDNQFSIRMTRVLEELTDINQITQQAALATSLPATPRNQALLAKFHANIENRELEGIPVEVRGGGRPIAVDRVTVLEWRDRENRIEVEFFGGGWISDLEKLRLRDLDLGAVDYTNPNVLLIWGDNYTPFPLPIADYGAWDTPNEVNRKDLRFWFNLRHLMDAAFCAIGWDFESSYYDSAAGARISGYLSGERWHTYDGKSHEFRVDLGLVTPRVFPFGNFQLIILDELSDPFDLYNSASRPGEYLWPPAGPSQENPVILRILFNNIEVELPAYGIGNKEHFFTVTVYRLRPPEVTYIFTRGAAGRPDQPTKLNLSYELEDPECRQGDSYGIFVAYQSLDGSQQTNFTLNQLDCTFSPDPKYLVPDDTIPIAQLLDEDLNGLDLFKAMVHLCAGKIETDHGLNKVKLFPPHDTELAGDFIEGFYQRTKQPIEITDLVEPNSRIITIEEEDRERFYLLKFKDSTDKYIETLGLENVYARRIDTGSGKAETKEIENPLFEPTKDRLTDVKETGGTAGLGIWVPVLWDNTDGNISSKLGFRVGYNYGTAVQLDTAGASTHGFTFEGANRTVTSYMSQDPVPALLGTGPKIPVVFARYQNDLYELFYKRELQERLSPMKFEFLVFLDLDDFEKFSFRRPIGFFYQETFLTYQTIALRDFPTGQSLAPPTPIEFRLIECNVGF